MPTTGRRLLPGALLLLLLPGLAAAGAEIEPPTEQWFVVQVDQQPVGSLTRVVELRDASRIERSTFTLALDRLGSRVAMTTRTTTQESPGGLLQRAKVELELSRQSTRTVATVGERTIRIREQVGDQWFERQLPYEGELLGPGEIRRRSAVGLRQPGDAITFQTFSAELGAVLQVTRRAVARSLPEEGGRQGPALEVEETSTALPLKTRLWLGEDGTLLRSQVPSPFGAMVAVRSSEAAARLAVAGGGLPAQAYAQTLARTQVRLPRPREAERLVLEIRHRNPELGWPELERPGQRVLDRSAERLVLETVRRRPPEPAPRPAVPDEASLPYLRSNAYLQADQPELVALARQLVGNERDPWRAARRLQRWVAESVRFDLGVVFAPSSEVLAERRGTCTEYAVLLTALARAAGIPARFVLGLVYVGGIFGGHAWTEVRIGGEWIAIDGAVPADGPADAARIALLDTDLEGGPGALGLGPGALLYGQIDVAVLGYQGPGLSLTWESADPGATVEGETYRNAALGVQWTRPAAGLTWADLQSVWPNPALVSLRGASGEAAALEVRDRSPWAEPSAAADRWLAELLPGAGVRAAPIGGSGGRRAESAGRAAVAWSRGSELWRLRVEGEGAPHRLDQLLAGLTFTEPAGSAAVR